MDTLKLPAGPIGGPRHEAGEARRRRIAWEAAMIAEAEADIAAGRLVDESEADAWIDSLGTDHELPVPTGRR